MYKGFAEIYDNLTRDIDYVKWADYMESAFLKFGNKPSLILELGCGTGSLTIELAKRGYEMIGLDLSEDMLFKASEKARNNGCDILFINQDMREFELYGTVDAVICLLDSVNYITHKKDLQRVFKLVHNYLNPQGLFIFDINTQYKISEVLSGQTFYEIDDEITWIWNNTYHAASKTCTFELTFFVKTEDGLYKRIDEIHTERAYSDEEIKEALQKSELTLLEAFGELNFKKPKEKEQRIFYISRKESS